MFGLPYSGEHQKEEKQRSVQYCKCSERSLLLDGDDQLRRRVKDSKPGKIGYFAPIQKQKHSGVKSFKVAAVENPEAS